MNKLREIRIEKGFTQKELAEAVGLGTTTITNYERDFRKISVPVAVAMGEVLDVEWTVFFDADVLAVKQAMQTMQRKGVVKNRRGKTD
ncbi:MAG: helix-turn-helix transcriptional regulator [Alkalibacterium sp.]|nr:helix-turn-helix transcriptional regulator [Alkalibacterium sp.]